MISSSNLTNTNNRERLFRRLALLTVLAIYLLILAGGIVRSTGSGMGCPDWPRCFGRWIPPTELSQLPSNYRETYGAKLKGEIEFNPVKTWIEYINRLLGAFSGLLVFATVLVATPFLRSDKTIFYGSFLSLILIGVNGWLGSRVVATELAPYMVTLHMLLAILVVFVLLYIAARSRYGHVTIQIENKAELNWLLILTLCLSIVQVLLGTQVRESMDEVISQLGYNERYRWVSQLDYRFYIHRSFSLIILALHSWVIFKLKRSAGQNELFSKLVNALMLFVLIEIGTGITLAYLGVPPIAQPIHLTLAIVMLGLQFTALLLLNANRLLSNRATQLSRYSNA